jgi:predicted DNA-binding antitoxin AbrB/MazE fold protein
MAIEVSATYENGTLKLDSPLPIPEHQRVMVTVHEETSIAERSYGTLDWTGNPEIARRIAEDVEFGVEEAS